MSTPENTEKAVQKYKLTIEVEVWGEGPFDGFDNARQHLRADVCQLLERVPEVAIVPGTEHVSTGTIMGSGHKELLEQDGTPETLKKLWRAFMHFKELED